MEEAETSTDESCSVHTFCPAVNIPTLDFLIQHRSSVAVSECLPCPGRDAIEAYGCGPEWPAGVKHMPMGLERAARMIRKRYRAMVLLPPRRE